MELEIAQKELEIIQKKAELERLEGELKILHIKNKGKGKITLSSLPNPNYKKALTGETQKFTINPDEKKNQWYTIVNGNIIDITSDASRIKDLPESQYKRSLSFEEAKKTFEQVKRTRSLIPNNPKIREELRLSHFPLGETKLAQLGNDKLSWIENHRKLITNYDEHLLVAKKQGYSKGIALEGVNSIFLAQTFESGLISTIYPDSKLTTLRHLPKLQQVVKIFSNNLKLQNQEKKIFLKVLSSLPDWSEDVVYQPYHLVKIGVINDKIGVGKLHDEEYQLPTENYINLRRLDGLYDIFDEVQKITDDSRIKLNYSGPKMIIYSSFKRKISKKELDIINKWVNNLYDNPDINPEHKIDFDAMKNQVEKKIKEEVSTETTGENPEVDPQDPNDDGLNSMDYSGIQELDESLDK